MIHKWTLPGVIIAIIAVIFLGVLIAANVQTTDPTDDSPITLNGMPSDARPQSVLGSIGSNVGHFIVNLIPSGCSAPR